MHAFSNIDATWFSTENVIKDYMELENIDAEERKYLKNAQMVPPFTGDDSSDESPRSCGFGDPFPLPTGFDYEDPQVQLVMHIGYNAFYNWMDANGMSAVSAFAEHFSSTREHKRSKTSKK